MAGAFTHITVSDTAAFAMKRKPLGKVLKDYPSFLSLGSVSPDIPYLHHLAHDDDTWANIFHYFNTGSIVENGLHTLAKMDESTSKWAAQLSWLCGFLSHLITDATIHPIVEAAVGPVADPSTKDAHMKCEMVQDVLIMKEVMNVELIYAEYTNDLHDATLKPEFDAVMEFWTEHAHMGCPLLGRPNPYDWMQSYTTMLDSGEGGGLLGKIARHVGIKYAYDEVEDIGPALREKYYDKVRLPDGKTGSFKTRGFDEAVKNVKAAWELVEKRLLLSKETPLIAANWNLDTGIDQDTGNRTYWS